MKKITKRLLAIILCFSLTAVLLSIPASADTASSLKNDIAQLQEKSKALEAKIKKLKADKSNQSALLEAIREKIANTQAQVLRCNKEIESINSKIAANKAEIDKKNKELDKNKLEFKKRLRAIYMSNTGSGVQVLLGAEDFSQFLQLSQLTSSVSSRDKKMMEDIVVAVEQLNEKNAENNKLLEEQVGIRQTIVEAQKALEAEENEAESIYNKISADQSTAENDNKKVEADIKEKTQYLNSILNGGNQYNDSFINPNTGFMWPVPSCRNITSYYGPRWGTVHRGIDISNGSIYGKPIVAVADGVVYQTYSSCPHTTRSSRCRCGSGWGNHVAINHGTMNGAVYKAMYAHMNTIAASVGQKVKQGQVIGYVGTTGDSTGYHLHFGLMKNNVWVDPLPYLRSVK